MCFCGWYVALAHEAVALSCKLQSFIHQLERRDLCSACSSFSRSFLSLLQPETGCLTLAQIKPRLTDWHRLQLKAQRSQPGRTNIKLSFTHQQAQNSTPRSGSSDGEVLSVLRGRNSGLIKPVSAVFSHQFDEGRSEEMNEIVIYLQLTYSSSIIPNSVWRDLPMKGRIKGSHKTYLHIYDHVTDWFHLLSSSYRDRLLKSGSSLICFPFMKSTNEEFTTVSELFLKMYHSLLI